MKTTIATTIIITLALAATCPAVTSAKLPRTPIQPRLSKLDLPIKKVEFKNAKLNEVLDYLSSQAHVNIVYDASALQLLASQAREAKKTSPRQAASPAQPRTDLITIRLHNVPLREVLKYVLRMKGLTYIVEEYAILIVPIGTVPHEPLVTKYFRLSTPAAWLRPTKASTNNHQSRGQKSY